MLDFSISGNNAGVFRQALKELDLNAIRGSNITEHLCQAGVTNCKQNCYNLLKIYKDITKASKQFNEYLLFSSNEEYKAFANWYSRQCNASKVDSLYSDYQ